MNRKQYDGLFDIIIRESQCSPNTLEHWSFPITRVRSKGISASTHCPVGSRVRLFYVLVRDWVVWLKTRFSVCPNPCPWTLSRGNRGWGRGFFNYYSYSIVIGFLLLRSGEKVSLSTLTLALSFVSSFCSYCYSHCTAYSRSGGVTSSTLWVLRVSGSRGDPSSLALRLESHSRGCA
jgi:hypothetical protein